MKNNLHVAAGFGAGFIASWFLSLPVLIVFFIILIGVALIFS